MFAAPVLMLLITLCTAVAGLFIFIQSGNHVYIESSDQYSRAEEILYHAVFHGKTDEAEIEDASGYRWLVQVLDPEQNYVLLRRADGTTVLQYGNSGLRSLFPNLPDPGTLREMEHPDKGVYARVENNEYCTLRKRTVGGTPYSLLFISHQAPHGTDDRLEHVSRGTLIFLGLALLAFIGFTSWFLADFMIRPFAELPPLRQLREGAERVEQGDLTVRLHHEGNDEFAPVFHAFNTMTGVLGESLRQRAEDEERRKAWIASLSHDIRTPLTAIRAYVEGLMDGVADSREKRDRYLQIILRRTGELDAMIDQLSLLSKIDMGEKAVPLERIDLNEFLEAAAADSREAFRRKGLDIRWEGGPPCHIEANRLLLERVLMNLFTNSAKYKDRSRGELRLTVAAENGRVILTAADDGPGVPEEALPHLFEMFYRTDKARSRTGDGSGLGLAIAARAMELMHGSIRAENGIPRGLVIRLDWPAAEAPDEMD